MNIPFFSSPEEDLGAYILLEARDYGAYSYPDVLLSLDSGLHAYSLRQQEDLIHRERGFLPTLRQLVDILSLLRQGTAYTGKGGKLSRSIMHKLLDHYFSYREPFRGERLDGTFSFEDDECLMTHHLICPDGSLEKITHRIDSSLLEEHLEGVDFDGWLNSPDPFGFPTLNLPKRRLRYRPPMHECVLWYGIDEYGPILSCQGTPHFKDAHFGVRRMILKKDEGKP